MKNNKNILAIISASLTVLYVLILIYRFFIEKSSDVSDSAIKALAFTILLPHFILVIIGMIFNIIGSCINKKGFVLTGAILYSVSMLLFPPYLFFVVVQTVLSYVAYAQMKKSSVVPVGA